MAERITQQLIATKAGVHSSTVSLALADHPSIPLATRKRIKALAIKLGYRRDPLLAALVSYRKNRPPTEKGVLGWIDLRTDKKAVLSAYGPLWDGAFERARDRGWKLEIFLPAQDGLSLPKLSRILRARGIQGLVIAPLPDGVSSMNLEWPWFSAVVASRTLLAPRLHSIAPHQAYNMRLLCLKTHALGYRAPGLFIGVAANERVGHNWVGAFLDFQHSTPGVRAIPPLTPAAATDPAKLVAWARRHRPDVIITTRPAECVAILGAAGIRIPADVGLAQPSGVATGSDLPLYHVDECFAEVGRRAIDTLEGMIHRHETGVPAKPLSISIEGELRDGPTLRARGSARGPARSTLNYMSSAVD
jgi:DNA-binding LacI/PurR family transcriptional regulator